MPDSGPSSFCVKLTNIPLHATERDIAAFLDVRLAYPGALQIAKDGNAYAELASEFDSVRALRQHRAYLGLSCLQLFLFYSIHSPHFASLIQKSGPKMIRQCM